MHARARRPSRTWRDAPRCAVLLLLIASCAQRSGPDPHATRVLVDDLGRQLRFDAPVRRCVSLAPSITETIYALGADSLLAAVTRYCDYPAAARSKPSVGDMVSPDIERIVSLDPDVVFLTVEGNTRQTFETLERLGVRTFATNPRSIDGVLKTIADLGAVLGRGERARRLRDSLRGVIDSIGGAGFAASAARPAVLLLVSLQPLMAAGSETFIGELIARAGGRSPLPAGSGSYPMLSREELLRASPDLLLLSSDIALPENELLRRFPEWRVLPAARRHRIAAIDANVVLRPGPRIVDGLRRLALLLRNEAP